MAAIGDPTVWFENDPTYHRVRCSSQFTQGGDQEQDQSHWQDGTCLLRPEGGERERAAAEGLDADWCFAAWRVIGWQNVSKKRSPRLLAEPQNHVVRRGEGAGRHKRKDAAKKGRPTHAGKRGEARDKAADSCGRQARPQHTATAIVSLTLVQSRWQGWVVRSQCCRRHHRNIQTIARLSPPVVIASALLAEPRRSSHRDGERKLAEEGRTGRRGSHVNGCRRAGTRGSRLRATRSCDRCPGRRCTRPARPGPLCARAPRPKRGLLAPRERATAPRSLVSFVLFLPWDDDPLHLVPPLSAASTR